MKRFIALLLFAIVTVTAVGQDDANFLIERIEVRGLDRMRPAIVVSESGLDEGREYGEREIDEATDRVRRLPFVREAAASLERGSERGRFVLVFTVNETLPFFVAVINDDDAILESETGLLAGWRWFLGANSVVHLAATLDQAEGVQAGFTRYGLFGGRSFLHVSLGYGLWDTVNEDGEGLLTGELLFAVPIGANDALRFGFTSEGRTARRMDGTEEELRESSLEMLWVRDRTNDPFFPTRGFAATAGVEYSNLEMIVGFRPIDGIGSPFDLKTETVQTALLGSLVHYLPAGESSAFWGSARFRVGRNDWKDLEGSRDRDLAEWTVRAGWAGGPFAWMQSPTRSMRFELGAVYDYRKHSSGDGIFSASIERAGFRTGFAFRNDWAIIRVFAEWLPHEEVRR